MGVLEDDAHRIFTWGPPTAPPPPAPVLCWERRWTAGLLFLSSSARRPGRHFRGKRTAHCGFGFAADRVESRGPGQPGRGEDELGPHSPRSARLAAAHPSPIPRVRLSPSVG